MANEERQGERPAAPASGETGRLKRLWARIRSLPVAWRIAAGAVLLAAAGGAGFYAYETYDYVQHDNQFCLSCHLMQRPYERFARSAHRGLSCKACHQPTFAARSQMALTQVVEQPDSLSAHAEVPNERCVECHVEGSPDEWTLIENTAGHRAHLESEDPALEGLQCVTCHSVSIHEFAPTNRTCGQAGCHEEVEVQLGAMGDLTVHCVACHDFTRPVDETGSGGLRTASAEPGLLQPQREECLSCHAMRSLVGDLPEDEPHGASCGSCHNPHEQATPAAAVRSCTESGCHARADTLPNFHHQRESVDLADCAQCHRAHEFRIEEENCLDCHRDIFEDEVSLGAPVLATLAGGGDAVVAGLLARDRSRREARRPRSRQEAGDRPPSGGVEVAGADTVEFRHSDHENMDCQTCHETGMATVSTNLAFCRECHHEGPRSELCGRCHQDSEIEGRSFEVRRTLRLSVGEPGERTLSFPHGEHTSLPCADCHTAPTTLGAGGTDCAECHEEHHEEEATCGACHLSPPDTAHPRRVHVTCSGSGCHASVPDVAASRERSACLACHEDQEDHMPGRDCAECHVLPPPGSVAEGGNG